MDRSIFTLNKLYQNSLRFNGNKIAFHFDGISLSYEKLRRASNRVAHALMKNGVKPNTTVALLMSNCLEYPISEMGIYQAGATRVSLNDMLGEKEVSHILKDSGAEVAIIGENFYEVLKNMKSNLPALKVVVVITSEEVHEEGFITWEDFQGNNPDDDIDVVVSPNDMGVIYYTGGTTGLPKGVVQTQENMVMTVYSQVIELSIEESDKLLLTSPLPHAAGLTYLGGLAKGAEHYVERRFDPQRVIQLIINEKITYMYMVPTMIYRLLDRIKGQSYDFSSIRTILYGAAPITAERLKEALEVFGPVFMQVYGLSECTTFLTRLKKEDHTLDPTLKYRLRSSGRPVLMSQVRIVDSQGNEVPRGTEGEIIVSSPGNMKEYYKQPEKTLEILKHGWIYTGDMGMMDDGGYLYLLDRKKDMIISGGMNVYSSEVENVVQQHQDISQVAVIGIPHSDWGEQVVAFIIPKPNKQITEESIKELCNQNLSKYKRPKQIFIVDSLPTTPYGKIDKKALRKPYWDKVGRNIG
nr:long-chain-fatty-acid--CoA ligase [Fredinandcohnia onubensis]